MKLWLDDFRESPGDGWNVVRGYRDFIVFIDSNGVPEHIDFDHDLGACQDCVEKGLHIGNMETPETTFMNWCTHAKTGYDCALYLIEKNLPIKSFFVHSANPIGRKRIHDLLTDWQKGIKPAKLNWS